MYNTQRLGRPLRRLTGTIVDGVVFVQFCRYFFHYAHRPYAHQYFSHLLPDVAPLCLRLGLQLNEHGVINGCNPLEFRVKMGFAWIDLGKRLQEESPQVVAEFVLLSCGQCLVPLQHRCELRR